MDTSAALKARLRRELRSKRAGLEAGVRAEAEARVAALLLAVASGRGARRVAVYAAKGDELDVERFAAAWRSAGGVTAYPRVVAPGQLVFARVEDPGALAAGFRGLREPSAAAAVVAASELDLVLVPGLAFDAAGGRLGQGGGFYDRWLAAPERRALALGVGFAVQRVARVPVAPHDVLLDGLVTEDGVVWARPVHRADAGPRSTR